MTRPDLEAIENGGKTADYRQLFECRCRDLHHVMSVTAFDWDDDESSLSFVLMPDVLTPWQRIKAAFHCLFGTPEASTETLVSAEQAHELGMAILGAFPSNSLL